MIKALQGFWRGGLLGGMLGLLGGEVFGVGLFLDYELQKQDVVSELYIQFESFLFFQIIIVLPALIFGLAVGAVLGIPFKFIYTQNKLWHRIVGSIIGVNILHQLIVYLVNMNRPLDHAGHFGYYVVYQGWTILILLITSILFGYYFPKFTPRWPRFLRKKQPQT